MVGTHYDRDEQLLINLGRRPKITEAIFIGMEDKPPAASCWISNTQGSILTGYPCPSIHAGLSINILGLGLETRSMRFPLLPVSPRIESCFPIFGGSSP